MCSPGNRRISQVSPGRWLSTTWRCAPTRPVQQKVRRQALDRQDFINEEIRKLKRANFVREVLHPTWMANPVVVPKANGKKTPVYRLHRP